MRSIRHIGLTALITIGIFSVVTYTSCKKDKANANAAYVGTYSDNETCNPSINSTPFSVVITASSTSSSTIVISNFAGSSQSVNATVSGNNVVLTQTTLTDGSTAITVSGSGTLSGNILTLTSVFIFTDGSGSFTCTDQMTKQ